jgi:hypothetical protein
MPETAPTVFSGESGAVKLDSNVYAAVKSWTISKTAGNTAYVDSATKGATTRGEGNKDWTGSFSADGYPAVAPGETVTFLGTMDAVKGCSGSAIIESVKVDWDFAGGGSVAHEVTFAGNGVLTLGAAVAADASICSPVSCLNGKVELATPAASPSWTELAGVENVSITFTRPGQTYVDTSTDGWTKRKRGALDWTASIRVHPDSNTGNAAYGLEGLPQPGTIKGIKVTDAQGTPLSYTLNWGMFADVSDVAVSRETQGIVSATLAVAMCATTLISGVATAGSITLPDASVMWPE